MELLSILTVLIVLFIVYFAFHKDNQYWFKDRICQPLSMCVGTWYLDPQDQALFGLKSYILHVPKCSDKNPCYLIVENDKCIIYDNLVDFKGFKKIQKQEELDPDVICFEANIVQYGEPILPENIQIQLNSQKKQLIIKDQQVTLAILYQYEQTNNTNPQTLLEVNKNT